MSETVSRVVRTLGSERTHVAVVPVGQFGTYTWLGAEFTGVSLPLVTRCGAELAAHHRVAVCMKAGTRVRCPRCRRLTRLERAPEGNELPPVVAEGGGSR